MWGVIVTGIILMVGIEFIFYTRFVGIKSRIHPFILLVGVFGGISVFGVFGFIIGPLLLANSIQLLQAAVLSNEDDEPDKTKPAPHLENKAKPTHHLEPTK